MATKIDIRISLWKGNFEDIFLDFFFLWKRLTTFSKLKGIVGKNIELALQSETKIFLHLFCWCNSASK